jgi:hypothetical protein
MSIAPLDLLILCVGQFLLGFALGLALNQRASARTGVAGPAEREAVQLHPLSGNPPPPAEDVGGVTWKGI